MTFKTFMTYKEGFDDRYGIEFSNGLKLASASMLWKGGKENDKVSQQFQQVVDALVKAGLERKQ